MNGSFAGSQLHCNVIEKQAHPMISALDRLRHLLVSDRPFRTYTDYGDLVYMFNQTRRRTLRRKL
jgi:hypothetical protein